MIFKMFCIIFIVLIFNIFGSSLHYVQGVGFSMQHAVLKKAKADDPIFDETLKVQYAKEGTNYKLKCKVNQDQALKFWTVDKVGPAEPKYKVLYDSDLLIRNVTEEDFSREYFCHTILRGRALVESMQIVLRPRSEEVLSSAIEKDVSSSHSANAKHIYGIVGELKTLQCNVHARPYPDFKWLYRNGTLIHNKTDFIITSIEDASNLTIFMRDAGYYGEYVCEAWNNLGRTEQHFTLKMPEKPREIPFIFPRSLGLTKINLGIQFDKSKNYTVNVQYKTQEESDWTEKWMDNTGDEVSLINLSSNTTYIIRAALKNQFILGDYSDVIQVTTDKLPNLNRDNLHLERGGRGRKISWEGVLPGRPEFSFFNEPSSLTESKTVNATTWTSTKMFRDPITKKVIILKSTIEEVFDGDSGTPPITTITTEK